MSTLTDEFIDSRQKEHFYSYDLALGKFAEQITSMMSTNTDLRKKGDWEAVYDTAGIADPDDKIQVFSEYTPTPANLQKAQEMADNLFAAQGMQKVIAVCRDELDKKVSLSSRISHGYNGALCVDYVLKIDMQKPFSDSPATVDHTACIAMQNGYMPSPDGNNGFQRMVKKILKIK